MSRGGGGLCCSGRGHLLFRLPLKGAPLQLWREGPPKVVQGVRLVAGLRVVYLAYDAPAQRVHHVQRLRAVLPNTPHAWNKSTNSGTCTSTMWPLIVSLRGWPDLSKKVARHAAPNAAHALLSSVRSPSD